MVQPKDMTPEEFLQRLTELQRRLDEFNATVAAFPAWNMELTDPIVLLNEEMEKLLASAADVKTALSKNDPKVNILYDQVPSDNEKKLQKFANSQLFAIIKKGFQLIGETAEDAGKKANSLMNGIKNGALIASEGLGHISKATKGLDKNFDFAMEGIMGVMDGFAKGGLAGGLLSLTTTTLSRIFAANKEHKEAMKKLRASQIKEEQAYWKAMSAEELKYKAGTNAFKTDTIMKAVNSLQVYAAARKKLQETMEGNKDAKSSTKGIFSHMLGLKNNSLDGLYGAKIVTGHKKGGFLKKGKDTYSTILSVYPDLIEGENKLNMARLDSIIATQKMDDKTKQLLVSLKEQQEAAEKALAEFNSYITSTFGPLADGMVTAVVNAIEKGEDAMLAFGKTAASVLADVGKQVAYNAFMKDMFDNFQKNITELYSKDMDAKSLGNAVTNEVARFFNEAKGQMQSMEDFLREFDKQAEAAGLNAFNEKKETTSVPTASAKGFETISQDTASELNGRFTRLQMLGEQSVDIYRNLATIAETDAKSLEGLLTSTVRIERCAENHYIVSTEMRDIAQQSMLHLQNIDSNTLQTVEVIQNETNHLLKQISNKL